MTRMKTDVLVIGGGTAGFGAAVAAARTGLDVCLVEAGSKVGGVMAFCPGMPWGAAYPCDTMIGGLMEELSNRLFGMDPPAAEKRPCTLENFGPEIVYDHDIATLTMFEMLEEAGVRLRLNCIAGALSMAEGRIRAVTCHDRRGADEILAGVVIDCSGDGDISARAGVPFTIGDAEGNMMGVTLSFMMVGADWARVFAEGDPYFRRHAAEGIAAGHLHPDLGRLYLMKGFHPGTVFCNSVIIRDVDGTDPAAVAGATQEGRRRCVQLAGFLKNHVPGFEAAFMTALGPTVGVRETRKLRGLYRLTGEDLARGARFDDAIVCCDNPIDDVMRKNGALSHEAAVGEGRYFTIPFRCLVSETVPNLLFAGRILSADPVAFASARGMPQCMAMGQAAGTAAALALAAGAPVQAVDPATLVAALQVQGVRGLGGEPLRRGAAA